MVFVLIMIFILEQRGGNDLFDETLLKRVR